MSEYIESEDLGILNFYGVGKDRQPHKCPDKPTKCPHRKEGGIAPECHAAYSVYDGIWCCSAAAYVAVKKSDLTTANDKYQELHAKYEELYARNERHIEHSSDANERAEKAEEHIAELSIRLEELREYECRGEDLI